ncbi:MAG: hypothetical protein II098_00325 [Treponema sp.]|jgi:hypothetical protein|nr:hypothetical protein [Treponema sp.]
MAKISDEQRQEFSETIKPYQSKITAILGKEKTVLNTINSGAADSAYKKIMLSDDMIYVSTLYMAENSLSLKILDVKNNESLNESRKIIYKSIIYLEELISNVIDVPYVDLVDKHDTIKNTTVKDRYYHIKKLGLAINLLELALGDNSKWKWSFVELKGRYAVVAKNFIDMREAAKVYFNPSSEDYETTVLYIRLITKLLEQSAAGYRDKYELSTRRIDDMRNGIKFLLARHKLALALGDKANAEEIKKKAMVWREKMDADQKSGSTR